MSEKKREIVALLEQMPEEKVDFVIEFIRQMEIWEDHKSERTPKMQAFQRMEKLRKQTMTDVVVDYDEELAKAREEKYGCFD